jgi:hypothetical protein
MAFTLYEIANEIGTFQNEKKLGKEHEGRLKRRDLVL